MTLYEMIAVLQAAKDGKVIEEWSKNDGAWVPKASYLGEQSNSWDFTHTSYRIKPREWWIVFGKNIREAFTDASVAKTWSLQFNYPVEIVHVREVNHKTP